MSLYLLCNLIHSLSVALSALFMSPPLYYHAASCGMEKRFFTIAVQFFLNLSSKNDNAGAKPGIAAQHLYGRRIFYSTMMIPILHSEGNSSNFLSKHLLVIKVRSAPITSWKMELSVLPIASILPSTKWQSFSWTGAHLVEKSSFALEIFMNSYWVSTGSPAIKFFILVIKTSFLYMKFWTSQRTKNVQNISALTFRRSIFPTTFVSWRRVQLIWRRAEKTISSNWISIWCSYCLSSFFHERNW